ncbi:MAG: metalloregulator ArsR/SmtB family transcription factor [Akkermansiaceae bacterium]|nr:metalloregulator ArsR/SmtB family transcription factor [Akkermansiaceae bacterium]
MCIYRRVEVINIYKCLCDEQRLRILNLLKDGPLCVCHLMEILDSDQVKISKQLRYMKDLGMIEGERVAQWMVYRIAETKNPLLEENLKCLQDSAGESLGFSSDTKLRKALLTKLESEPNACASSILPFLQQTS